MRPNFTTVVTEYISNGVTSATGATGVYADTPPIALLTGAAIKDVASGLVAHEIPASAIMLNSAAASVASGILTWLPATQQFAFGSDLASGQVLSLRGRPLAEIPQVI